jgi:hypothetical protein
MTNLPHNADQLKDNIKNVSKLLAMITVTFYEDKINHYVQYLK